MKISITTYCFTFRFAWLAARDSLKFDTNVAIILLDSITWKGEVFSKKVLTLMILDFAIKIVKK